MGHAGRHLEEGCGAGKRLRPHGADPAVDVHIHLRRDAEVPSVRCLPVKSLR